MQPCKAHVRRTHDRTVGQNAKIWPFGGSHRPPHTPSVAGLRGASREGERVILRIGRGDRFFSLRMRADIAQRKRKDLESKGWRVDVVPVDEADEAKNLRETSDVKPEADWGEGA